MLIRLKVKKDRGEEITGEKGSNLCFSRTFVLKRKGNRWIGNFLVIFKLVHEYHERLVNYVRML